MRELSTAEIYWMQQAALGPFSFVADRLKVTHAQGVTLCASTYNAMIAHGWAAEVI